MWWAVDILCTALLVAEWPVQRTSIAPAVVAVAAGMLTVPVAGDQGSSHGWGDGPGGPSDVERFRVGSYEDPADGAVTAIPADLAGGQHLAGTGLVDPPAVSLQGVEVGEDQDVGFFGPGGLSRVEEASERLLAT